MSGNVKAVTNSKPIKDLSQWVKPNPNATILDSKDFYKELRLRGYHYSGSFKSVTEVQSDGTVGKIKWTNNWPSFMDSMLQVNILAIDSRSLYLPTSIRKIRINTSGHLKAVEQLDPENPVMQVLMNKELGTVTCGGIEIEGLICSSVSRRKPPGTEVLESYEFVPFNNESIEYLPVDAVSIITQICMENLMQYKIKIVEVDDTNEPEVETETESKTGSETQSEAKIEKDTKTETNTETETEAEKGQDAESEEPELNTLIKAFDEVIINMPLIVADLTLLRKKKAEVDHVKVEDGDLKGHTNCHLIIGSNWLSNKEAIEQAHASLIDKGFLVLREDSHVQWIEIECPAGFNLISLLRIPDETLILLQRIPSEEAIQNKTHINIDSTDMSFEWLQPLKDAIKNGVTIAVEQNNHDSGVIGLINCIRREPGGNMIRCVLIDDKSAPQFDLNHDLYSNQLKLDLAMNVFRKGQWGAYRHISLKKDMEEKTQSGHYYADVLRIGDLSSFGKKKSFYLV